jgi:hypothetical protein
MSLLNYTTRVSVDKTVGTSTSASPPTVPKRS